MKDLLNLRGLSEQAIHFIENTDDRSLKELGIYDMNVAEINDYCKEEVEE